MAKPSKPASAAPGKTARAPRKAATAPASAALDNQETGAEAPVSSLVEQAVTGDTSTTTSAPAAPADNAQPDPGAGQVAPVFVRREFFPGMGRFPADWKPKPAPQSEESDSAEGEQTADESEGDEALQSPSWGLPDIAEFPAELTLVNNTRNILVVRPLNTRLLQFSTKTVQCPTAKQYEAIKREFAGRARRERWDSDKGLRVTHGEHGEDRD